MQLYRVLKWIRVGVALLFFLLFTFIFIDFSGLLPVWVYNSATYLQFAPSILEFTQLLSWSAAGFAFIVLLSLLFGRIYCSTICPIGTLQDIMIRIHKRFRIARRFRYVRTYNILRYSILLLTILVFLSGSSILINLLDPFSGFGKIFANILRPLYVAINNLGALILNQFDVYSLYHVEYKAFALPAFLYAMGLMFLLSWLTLIRGRLFCNSICPVGTLLGLISKLSVFKLKIQENSCTNCWRCAMDCKAGCIDADKMYIDFSRCIGCLNCTISCPNNGLSFVPAWKSKSVPGKSKSADASKRNFIKYTALFSLGLHKILRSQDKIVPTKDSTIPEEKEFSVSPPGSRNINRFNELCTACHLCVSACPTQVLQASFFQYGLQGMFQPYLDYHKSFCNYECRICTDICPTGALLPLNLAEKKLTQIGQVHFEKGNCIVETEGTDCGACSEHCPTKAVYMVPYNGLFLPEIDQDICIGCGACEYACPTTPYKAIYVDGNPIHQQAKEPSQEKIQEESSGEDFPF